MKLSFKIIVSSILILGISLGFMQNSTFKLAVLKYDGGGDWYANPTSLKNLVEFCNKNIESNINPITDHVDVGSKEIFNYPFIHMTGHGNVIFSGDDAANLRKYLQRGGFLHIDDNYGMDKFIRRELKKVFPNQTLIELPFTHGVFHQKYEFPNGLPKVHEHDNKPPQAFGLFYESKLVLLYTYECDLGDGWEDRQVHNDDTKTRENAFKMGANIIQYAFNLGEID
ncbi:MAG: DUF4159 domain-containing protein [Flavobacteriales bacterium]|nr:DUF4159 domain-containing protein [Flavobacteriales bacterium]